MDFLWQILAVVVVANLFWIGVMFAAQEFDKTLPLSYSFIPGTNQRFLHMQDFYTMTYGDLFGVPLINNAFLHLIVMGHLETWHWLAFVLLAIVSSSIFVVMCFGPNHKPDMGFPQIGKISWIGLLHLPYLGVGVASAMLCLWFILAGDLRGPVLYLGLAGGAIYIASFVAETKSGNFDPLKRV